MCSWHWYEAQVTRRVAEERKARYISFRLWLARRIGAVLGDGDA